MEFKGTKEKWQKMSATQMGVPYIIFVGNETIFQCYGENALENTNLVIKAPEMLEMIKKFMAYMPKNNINDANIYHEAFELIKEATTI
jgi:hypothetical protein